MVGGVHCQVEGKELLSHAGEPPSRGSASNQMGSAASLIQSVDIKIKMEARKGKEMNSFLDTLAVAC